MENQEIRQHISDALHTLASKQSPAWHAGLDFTRALIISMINPSQPENVRSMGAMLLSYVVLSEVEGIVKGAGIMKMLVTKEPDKDAFLSICAGLSEDYNNLFGVNVREAINAQEPAIPLEGLGPILDAAMQAHADHMIKVSHEPG